MNEYKTIDSLLKKFANPIKEDYEALAVSLMKNFSIVKCEKDSEGVRNVKYRIADLEIYLYSTDDTEDVATLNTGQTHQNYSDKNCNISNCKALIINALDLFMLDIFRIFIV